MIRIEQPICHGMGTTDVRYKQFGGYRWETLRLWQCSLVLKQPSDLYRNVSLA